MRKPGRNEPCHCGSGLKYKKCCEEKDNLAPLSESTAQFNSVHSDFRHVAFENENDFRVDHDDDVQDWIDVDPEDVGQPLAANADDSSYTEYNPSKAPYPVITEPEEKLIDEWWDVYLKINDLDEIKAHLDAFIASHRNLVENLGLDHEVLFELSADYRKVGRDKEYFSFLLNFRTEFPSVYIRSASYYDFELIAWLIGENRVTEIGQYLNYFIEYPVSSFSQLDSLLQLMLATNNVKEVIPLLQQTAERLASSNELFYVDDIMVPLLDEIIASHLNKEITDDNIHLFLKEASQRIPRPLSSDDIQLWKSIFNDLRKPMASLPENLPVKQDEFYRTVSSLMLRFAAYLTNETGISFLSARYHARELYSFLCEFWKSKSKKEMFRFSRGRVSGVLSLIAEQSGALNDLTKCMTCLTSLYHFVHFASVCGRISSDQAIEAQEVFRDLWKKEIETAMSNDIVANCFCVFPRI